MGEIPGEIGHERPSNVPTTVHKQTPETSRATKTKQTESTS
jgi:hypothetical protein